MSGTDLVMREFGGVKIGQRADGYLNATAMCRANGKDFFDYERLSSSKEFMETLARSPGIPGDLTVKITTGPNYERGTWAHPQVAYHLAMWCSPAFAVQVTEWIYDIRTKGYATAPGGAYDRGKKTLAERRAAVSELIAANRTLDHLVRTYGRREAARHMAGIYANAGLRLDLPDAPSQGEFDFDPARA